MGALESINPVRSGQISAAEQTEQVLAGLDNSTGAFAHVCPDYALAEAERVDRALEEGADLPLAGLPLPIKDLTPVAGLPCEMGSQLMVGNIASVDAAVVRRLRDAGAIIIGKSTTPEFGFPAYTEPTITAPARNPWDPRRIAGGSSGGAAAAVASGSVPVAHASDGGGSIRIPAACCGLVGLKPSRGLISPAPGVAGAGLTTDGVISTTVADQALLLDVMAGNEPGDVYARPVDDLLRRYGSYVACLEHRVEPLRIGLYFEPLNVDAVELHDEAVRAAMVMAEVLASLGHEIVPVSRPITSAQWRSFMPLWTGGAASAIPASKRDQVTPLSAWLASEGGKLSGTDYAEALAGMQSLGPAIAAAWSDVDVVLTPTLSGPAPFPADICMPHDPEADFAAQCELTPWGSVWNMAGWASITLPIHTAEIDGVTLPFGAMISALRPGEDARLLALAAGVEDVHSWPDLPPSRSS